MSDLPTLTPIEEAQLAKLKLSMVKKGAANEEVDRLIREFFRECLVPAAEWCQKMGGMAFTLHTRATAPQRDELLKLVGALKTVQDLWEPLVNVPFRWVRGELGPDRQARRNAELDDINEFRSLLARVLPSVTDAAAIAAEEVKRGGTGQVIIDREAMMVQRVVKWLTAHGVAYAAHAGSPMIEAVKLAWEYWGLNEAPADEGDEDSAVMDRVKRLPEKHRTGDFQTAFHLRITE